MKNLYQEKIKRGSFVPRALALWRSGALALWRSGALALWRSGALALWRSGALALWRSGALALWRSGTLALCIIGIGLLVSCPPEAGTGADPVTKISIETLTYPSTKIDAETGTEIVAASPTLTPEGASATYTVKPALPEGLTLDSDGTISGTPTLAQTAKVYTVTATASGNYSGTLTATINITVQDDIRAALTGAFSYGDADNNITRDFGAEEATYNLTVDTAFNTDESTITYSIDPAVDGTGISFDTTNGELTVNSTANAQTQPYTVTASASSSSTTHKGSITADFTLTINLLPITNLTYSNTPIDAFINSPIDVASPMLTPTGASATYTIDPPLPPGLSLDNDGKISGATTLSQTTTTTEYTVTATASGNYSGTKTAKINITVQNDTRGALTGAFSYGDASNNIIRTFGAEEAKYNLTVDTAFNTDRSTITYSIDPAIDNTAVDNTGISFDTTNGELTVNSSANAQTQSYTVTASASSSSTTHKGSITADFTLTINQLPITNLTYSNTPIIVRTNSAITNPSSPILTPTGASATYTIDPALPTGLSLDSDGKISGIPTLDQTATPYVVRATASGNYSGEQTVTISIAITSDTTPIAGTLTYVSDAIFVVGGSITATPRWDGASARQTASYALDKTVQGITVDDNGIISVDSTASPQTSSAFIVTATGSGAFDGIKTATINIEIVAATRPQYERNNGMGGTTTVLGHTAGIPIAPPTGTLTFYPLADARTGNTYTLTRDASGSVDAAVTEPVLDTSTGALTLAANTTPGAYTISTGTGTVSTKVYVTTTPADWTALATAIEVGITNFGNTADYNYIIPSNITNFGDLFYRTYDLNHNWAYGARAYITDFNGDISGWDVSKATNMTSMFIRTKFDQDIGDWDVSKVTNFINMFNSSAFNQDIGDWDVSAVTDMSLMFYGTSSFIQDLEPWGEHLPLDGDGKATITMTHALTYSGVSGDLIPSWYPVE